MFGKVTVVPHDPRWKIEFEHEARLIKKALGGCAIAVHHIGSTSIPGISAKPVIDLLVEVSDLETLDQRNTAMRDLCYEVMGEFGIPGRRYFRKDGPNGVRTHQIHAFRAGSDQIERHLAFRDYLRTHPAEALEYSRLKRDLAHRTSDAQEYMDGKDAFIKEIDRRAANWRKAHTK